MLGNVTMTAERHALNEVLDYAKGLEKTIAEMNRFMEQLRDDRDKLRWHLDRVRDAARGESCYEKPGESCETTAAKAKYQGECPDSPDKESY